MIFKNKNWSPNFPNFKSLTFSINFQASNQFCTKFKVFANLVGQTSLRNQPLNWFSSDWNGGLRPDFVLSIRLASLAFPLSLSSCVDRPSIPLIRNRGGPLDKASACIGLSSSEPISWFGMKSRVRARRWTTEWV